MTYVLRFARSGQRLYLIKVILFKLHALQDISFSISINGFIVIQHFNIHKICFENTTSQASIQHIYNPSF